MTSKLKIRPSSVRDRYCLSFKSSKSISLAESPLGVLQARNVVTFFPFFPMIHSLQETKTLLPTSYTQGPIFNGS